MNDLDKKTACIIFSVMFCGFSITNPSFCTEKINAGVVYEFYLDLKNQIPSANKITTENLPKISDEDINLAFYNGYRPLNMLSLKNTYTIMNTVKKHQRYETIPEQYTISLKPNNAITKEAQPTYEELFALAMNLKNKEKYHDAIENVNKAIEKNPLSMEAHFLKGDILRQNGNYRDSITEYVSAINIDPSCTDAYFNIAKILENSDNKELALEYYRYAYSTKPDDYEIRNIILSYEKANIN